MQHKSIRLLITLITLIHLSENVNAQGITTDRIKTAIVEDSLCIEITFDVTKVDVTSSTGFTFTPVLRSRGKVVPLAPIVVTGKRRAAFDRRETALETPADYLRPFCIIYGNKADRGNQIDYRIRVAYSPWMNHASLALMQEVKDCCDMELLAVDTLTPDLNLNGGMINTIPETEKERTVAPTVLPTVTAPSGEKVIPMQTAVTPIARPSLPYATMVSYLTAEVETEKRRTERVVLYIDYPLNSYEVLPGYKQNRTELQKLDSLVYPFANDTLVAMKTIHICGFASPEGPYNRNEELASNRARYFRQYMTSGYRLPSTLLHATWVAEDWDGLMSLLESNRPMYHAESMRIIRQVGIFEGREKQLMDLRGGEPFRWMSVHLFPLLRRIQVTVDYDVQQVSNAQAAELIYTRPRLLSLQEMYRVARYYRPGTEQYREIYEIAAYNYPNDAIANINAGSAVLVAGDLVSAHKYLDRFKDDPRAWNDWGVLLLLEGKPEQAAALFRKAMGIEPYKARKNLELAEVTTQIWNIE